MNVLGPARPGVHRSNAGASESPER